MFLLKQGAHLRCHPHWSLQRPLNNLQRQDEALKTLLNLSSVFTLFTGVSGHSPPLLTLKCTGINIASKQLRLWTAPWVAVIHQDLGIWDQKMKILKLPSLELSWYIPEPAWTYVKQNCDFPLLIVFLPKHNFFTFLFSFGRLFWNSCFQITNKQPPMWLTSHIKIILLPFPYSAWLTEHRKSWKYFHLFCRQLIFEPSLWQNNYNK